MNFDTPLLSRQYTSARGVVPEFSDREFWSVLLLSKSYSVQPDVIYSLITSNGDRYVDGYLPGNLINELNEPLITSSGDNIIFNSISNGLAAASHPMGNLLTDSANVLETSSGDNIQYAQIN